MTNAMKVIIAQGILQTLASGNEEIVYKLKNGEIIEEELIDNFKLVKEAVDNGLSLTLPVRHRSTISSFIDHLLFEEHSNQMIDYICSKLTTEDVSNLSAEMVDHIYSSSNNNIDLLEKFFSLGFDFKQGQFDEYGKIVSSDIRFFELCLQMKSDFKFSFKYPSYENLTLDELLLEEIEYSKKANQHPDNIKNKESLYTFLKKARESEEWRDDLNNNLFNNNNSSNTIKKI